MSLNMADIKKNNTLATNENSHKNEKAHENKPENEQENNNGNENKHENEHKNENEHKIVYEDKQKIIDIKQPISMEENNFFNSYDNYCEKKLVTNQETTKQKNTEIEDVPKKSPKEFALKMPKVRNFKDQNGKVKNKTVKKNINSTLKKSIIDLLGKKKCFEDRQNLNSKKKDLKKIPNIIPNPHWNNGKIPYLKNRNSSNDNVNGNHRLFQGIPLAEDDDILIRVPDVDCNQTRYYRNRISNSIRSSISSIDLWYEIISNSPSTSDTTQKKNVI